MKKWHWFVLSCIVIIADQISKYWVGVHLMPYKPVPVIPMVNMTLAYNTGAAFSFLSGAGDWHRWFFAAFSFTVSVVLVIWLVRTAKEDWMQSAGISLILGGALGNLIDRGIHGYVIDFIDVYYQYHHFATFNVADSAICVGAAVLVLELMINRKGNQGSSVTLR